LSRSIDYGAERPTSTLIEQTRLVAYMAAGAVFLAWSANALELSPGELFRSLPVIGRYIARMVPPDWAALDDLWGPTLDTICIALW
jgi:ABC-type phosphate/phosphonate transport system permease subunit